MYWLISAFIVPVPVFHLWLHALLPWWRKRPFSIYVFGVFLWIGSFVFFYQFARTDHILFNLPSSAHAAGVALIVFGFSLAVWSFVTLGYKRFLVWPVLTACHPELDSGSRESGFRVKPGMTECNRRIIYGPFRFLPHPAYIGYCIVSVGNLLASGTRLAAFVVILMITLTPLAIRFEEEELKTRM